MAIGLEPGSILMHMLESRSEAQSASLEMQMMLLSSNSSASVDGDRRNRREDDRSSHKLIAAFDQLIAVVSLENAFSKSKLAWVIPLFPTGSHKSGNGIGMREIGMLFHSPFPFPFSFSRWISAPLSFSCV